MTGLRLVTSNGVRVDVGGVTAPDAHNREQCEIGGDAGVQSGPVAMFRNALGGVMPTPTYSYCACKYGEGLRKRHCRPVAKRDSLTVASRHDRDKASQHREEES